jgi:hypothetical protein
VLKIMAASGESSPSKELIDTRYVGFCDILGFSNKILTDFDQTLEIYKEFANSFLGVPAAKAVEITMYSDAVLLTSQSLIPVAQTIQNLYFVALVHNLMVRGAITKGRYWEQRQDNHMLVASDALARAVKIERSLGVPAVVIADDVEIPDEVWMSRFVNGVYLTPILHFRERNIVNPFNLFWGTSAGDRASRLMVESPAHKEKYLWFLSLYQAVKNNHELAPPGMLERFLREGILKVKTDANGAV